MEFGYFAMPSHPPERGYKAGVDWDLQTMRWLDEPGAKSRADVLPACRKDFQQLLDHANLDTTSKQTSFIKMKVTLEAPADLPARAFFEACGYKTEAILPQHTWKLDVAVMRKFSASSVCR